MLQGPSSWGWVCLQRDALASPLFSPPTDPARWGRRDQQLLESTGWHVRLCLVPAGGTPSPQGVSPSFGMGTGKAGVSGYCPLVAQLLSSGLFLATSNKASQPIVCPLIFATVIHPPAVLWEVCSQAGGGQDTRPGPSLLLSPLLPLQQVHLIVDQALKRFSEDRVGMVDYALESAGRWWGLSAAQDEPAVLGRGQQGAVCSLRAAVPSLCQGPASSTLAARKPTRRGRHC